MMTPEQYWDNFIIHLNKVKPLREKKVRGKIVTEHITPHINFLGSITEYKKIFIEANSNGKPPSQNT